MLRGIMVQREYGEISDEQKTGKLRFPDKELNIKEIGRKYD